LIKAAWRTWAAGTAACLITFAVWLPTIRFGFVYDDRGQILDNPQLRSWGYLSQYFREHTWAHVTWMPASFYRPLFVTWLRINYAIFATGARGWHLSSILMHVLATALVFALAMMLLRDGKVALIASMIFGLHPVHCESVAWLSGSTDVLATVLVLASICCFLCSTKNRRWWWVSIALYAIALLAKEVAIVGLVAVLIWTFFSEDVRTPRFAIRAGPFLGVTVIYLLLRQVVLGKLIAKASAISFGETAQTMPSIAVFYAKHLLWPTRLSGFYDINVVHSPSLGGFVLPLGVLLVAAFLLAIFGRQLRRTEGERAFYLALALLITPLLPAFYLRALEPGNFLHDRYLYMPVAGFALLIALAFQKLACNMPALVRPMLVAFCGMALSYALSSMVEAQVWKSDFSLFTRGAQVAPENMVVKSNLASELIRQQRCADAVPLLEQVVQRAPEMWFAHANLGNCYLEAGRGAQAEDELSIAVQLQPLPELVQRLHMLRARH